MSRKLKNDMWDGEMLQGCSKEELVSRVIQLQSHVIQLKNILAKQAGSNADTDTKPRKKKREFDFRRYNKRHVALKVCYFGWDYQGLAVQEDTTKTIEAEVFSALHKTCLIDSRENSNYHRCGRTDKGVSSFGQVLSLDLRSQLLHGPGLIPPLDSLIDTRKDNPTEEFNYVDILNKVLPAEIRILAWAPVEPDFSARFSCLQRTYRYYFPKGNLNIEAMKSSCQNLIGVHDFRNFCKMDVGNGVVEYTRHIYKVEVNRLETRGGSPDDGFSMHEVVVVGQAFLWHQVRCMVALLFLIGQGLESPTIITSLLDVTNNPCKPQFNMALDLPLVLYDCSFENINWQYDMVAHKALLSHLQSFWSRHAIKAEMVWQLLGNLEKVGVQVDEIVEHQAKSLDLNWKRKAYKPLMARPRCESLESRLEHKAKRIKADIEKLVLVNEIGKE